MGGDVYNALHRQILYTAEYCYQGNYLVSCCVGLSLYRHYLILILNGKFRGTGVWLLIESIKDWKGCGVEILVQIDGNYLHLDTKEADNSFV